MNPTPVTLESPCLFDTAVWTWTRDSRFPHLATWMNDAVRQRLVLVCDLVILELVRVAANEMRANDIASTLSRFSSVPMAQNLWARAREVQLELAASGDHRRVPPADLMIAAAAEDADVPIVHYDGDFERIAAVTRQPQRRFVPEGSLASSS